ncbi:MAG: sulfotransferase domain-containing protein, partial [Chloroflexi bacterium]|nr:sulfotransferase domain-containing protein [Chloroflexota bacterium]
PRTGTTALYTYLQDHPNVFMSEPKEPHFFAETSLYRPIKSLDAYMNLFVHASNEHTCVGEASTGYLASADAIQKIREFSPDARLLAMLRNPLELVHSYHQDLIHYNREDVTDFEQAWDLQPLRAKGEHLPPLVKIQYRPGNVVLQYTELGMLGKQVKCVLDTFPDEQVMLILQEDFRANPAQIYQDVLHFLDLPDDGRQDFETVNQTGAYRLGKFGFTLRHSRQFRKLRRVAFKSPLLKRVLNKAMITERSERQPLSPAFRDRLIETYRDDILLLADLLDRDLSHWISEQM